MELPNWGTAIGAVVNKVTQWIPGPIEKLKNEKEKLINERANLKTKPFTAPNGNRIIAIDNRLQQINSIIANKASD